MVKSPRLQLLRFESEYTRNPPYLCNASVCLTELGNTLLKILAKSVLQIASLIHNLYNIFCVVIKHPIYYAY
jgi:hypothetical protein